MPLYLSNTNRQESLQGRREAGINSTTTTTLTPPQYSFYWGVSGFGSTGSYFDVNYPEGSITRINVPDSWEISQGWANLNTYFSGIQTAFPGAGIYRSPFGLNFNVKPDIFGKVATFTNNNLTSSYEYMLATYIPWSGSSPVYEFVPPSSSIQRCVTYPAYTYFSGPVTGSGDTAYKALLGSSAYGADCQYDTYCECDLCYQNYTGGPAIISGSLPCSTVTTTTTSTTSTTTTTTTTTLAPTYTVEYLLVGGGGAGGYYNGRANAEAQYLGSGGGGAGGYVTGSSSVSSSVIFSVVVGDGGTPSDVSGSNTEAFSLTALGGGKGASTYYTENISTYIVGSGGGGSSRGPLNGPNVPGVGTIGQGNNGGVAVQGYNEAGGGGGGAGSAGSTPTSNTIGGGGAGKAWFDGIVYGKGGDSPGAGTDALLLVSSSNGTPNTGNGGDGRKYSDASTLAGGYGGSGIVVVRYPGTQRATGGTVIESGSYTYHYFTASGDFTA